MKRWYLREIFLSLRRTLSATIISVLGMSVGIVIFLLIMLYVRTELRVNKNLPEYENIYRISSEDGSRWQGTPARIGEILTANLPEVKNFARIDPGGMNHFIKVDNTPFRTGKFVYADSSFFKIFTLPFKFGDPDKSLEDKFNIVITESLSNSIFGDESPVGRMVRLDNRFDVYITGVIFDPGQETNIDGNVFISFHSMPEMKNWPDLYDCWGCYNYQTYLLLEENTDPLIVKTKINEALDRFGTDNSVQELIDDEFTLTDMHDVYFGPEERPDFRKGNYTQLRILGSIGILILIIAIINYINLSTANASSKLRQMALRKVNGASRRILISQIMGEAVLISIISVNVGLALLELVKPLFNSIMGLDIRIGYLDNPWIIPAFLLTGIIIGIISGIYPAISITGFITGRSMSLDIKDTSAGVGVRRVLSVFQVFVSIILITSTFVVYSQLRFIDKSDLGFDKDLLVFLHLNREIYPRADAFREELMRHPGIENVSYSYASYRTSNERWGFQYNNEDVLLHIEGVDENYLNTVGLELISGRDFRGMQDSGKIIINQISCKRYFGDNPEGTILEGLNGAEIIGVIKDFKFQTFDNEVEPIGLWYRPNMLNLCNIRFSGQEFSDALDHIEKTWNTFCNEYPYQCNFVDRLYEGRYNNQKRIAELLMFFSLISVFIASLGIFGLATFTVEKRSKEVGVRKVNGASVPEIIKLFAGDVNRIVLWSALPSFVTTYFIMNRWLDTFAYHVIMPWTLYVLSAIIVWLVAILSTAGKSLRTARINPTEVLRTE